MNNKTFDRSNSFTFFKNFRDSVDGSIKIPMKSIMIKTVQTMILLRIRIKMIVSIMAWFSDSFRTLATDMKILGSTVIYRARTMMMTCRSNTSSRW